MLTISHGEAPRLHRKTPTAAALSAVFLSTLYESGCYTVHVRPEVLSKS
jgi:hypothetical protein